MCTWFWFYSIVFVNGFRDIEISYFDTIQDYRSFLLDRKLDTNTPAGIRVNITNISNNNALCLDGSIPIFYYRNGSGSGMHKFNIYLQGDLYRWVVFWYNQQSITCFHFFMSIAISDFVWINYGFGAEDIVGLRKELVDWMIGNDDEWNWSLKVGDMKLEDFLPRHVSMLGAHIFALAMMLEMELKLYVQTNIDDVKMYKSDCSHPTKSDASSSDTMDSTNNPIKTRRKKKKRYKEKRESDDSSVDLMDSTNNSITTRRKKKKRHKEKRESDDSSVGMMDSTNNSRLNKKSKAKRNTNLRLNKKRVKQGDDAENGNNGKRRQNVGAALWLVGDYIDHCYHRANDPKARTKLSLRVSQTQHRSKYITSVLRAMLHQEVVFQKDDMNKQMTMKQWMENKKLDWKTICQKGWKRGVGAAADATCEIVYSALMSGALRAALAT
eukprot:703943_1